MNSQFSRSVETKLNEDLSNTVNVKDNSQVIESNEDMSDEKLFSRKHYIRSLSIARDPTAEPLFLFNRVRYPLGSSRHSVSLIDEKDLYTE